MSSYKLRSTSLKIINVPSQIIKKIGWDINDEVDVIIAEEYSSGTKPTHRTITIERVADYKKYYLEEK